MQNIRILLTSLIVSALFLTACRMESSAKSAIPYLLQNLNNDRKDVRRHSVFMLGIIGVSASCAVPNVASLLWDTDPVVRSTSAGALTEITQLKLVEDELYKLDPTTPDVVAIDEPEGYISGIARDWWLETGQKMTWPAENCALPE